MAARSPLSTDVPPLRAPASDDREARWAIGAAALVALVLLLLVFTILPRIVPA